MKKNMFWPLVVLILIVFIVFLLGKQYNWFNKSKYVATYLQTGELYFGEKTGWFGFNLKNAWLLNKGDDGKIGLQEFSKAAWKPEGTLHISKDKIVFWTNIDSASDLTKLIKGETQSSNIQSAQPVQSNSPTPSATTTTKSSQ